MCDLRRRTWFDQWAAFERLVERLQRVYAGEPFPSDVLLRDHVFLVFVIGDHLRDWARGSFVGIDKAVHADDVDAAGGGESAAQTFAFANTMKHRERRTNTETTGHLESITSTSTGGHTVALRFSDRTAPVDALTLAQDLRHAWAAWVALARP